MFNVNHIAISVSDMEKSIKFYRKFGFKDFENYKDEKVEITLLYLEEVVLEIFCYKEYRELPEHSKDLHIDTRTLGTKHFALGVDSIEKAKEYLIKNGLKDDEINIRKARLGQNYFFIKDPDGILVEVIEKDC